MSSKSTLIKFLAALMLVVVLTMGKSAFAGQSEPKFTGPEPKSSGVSIVALATTVVGLAGLHRRKG